MKLNEEHEYGKELEPDYLYKIGMFAQMNHITIKTLRFYEDQGLLAPAFVDQESGYRYYTMSQMSVLHQIQALKQIGFTLEDIKMLHAGADENAFLARKKKEIMTKISELTKQLALLEDYMTKDYVSLEAPVLIKTIPSAIVASMQATVQSYDDFFELMPEMGARMEELGCKCAIPEYCFIEYLESGYHEDQIMVAACEAVTEKKQDTDGLRFRVLPETQVASIFHKGSYNELARTYRNVLRYVEENGYEICGNIRENYIDGVWNKDSQEEWLTEIQVPVKKREK